ncbi:protein kinase [Achlya hypogyna]|uniref:Protein kinase n=1 Tax=Achlya hypogyna TaxID=1202772 RepID=A0A1V9YIY7_ACHHY|nr:protein kinase [Achlya hypogyna]
MDLGDLQRHLSSHVLLDTLKGTKLTGFGVATDGSDEDTMTRSLGSYQWMAPEVIKEAHYSTASDIYAFGVIVSELTTHKVPYEGMANFTNGALMSQALVMRQIAMGELMPSFSASAPEGIVALGRDCLALDPDARPTALQLTRRIDCLIGNLRYQSDSVKLQSCCVPGPCVD